MLHVVSHSDLLLRVQTPFLFHPPDSRQPRALLSLRSRLGTMQMIGSSPSQNISTKRKSPRSHLNFKPTSSCGIAPAIFLMFSQSILTSLRMSWDDAEEEENLRPIFDACEHRSPVHFSVQNAHCLSHNTRAGLHVPFCDNFLRSPNPTPPPTPSTHPCTHATAQPRNRATTHPRTQPPTHPRTHPHFAASWHRFAAS